MQSHSQFELGRLTERTRLLQELLDSQEKAEASLLGSGVAELTRINSQQIEICGKLRENKVALSRSDETSPRENVRPGKMEPLGCVQPWNSLRADVVRLEQRVEYRNKVFGALLRRAQRTVNIFGRAIASSALTYAPGQTRASSASHVSEDIDHV
jgi:hypothetical protein